MLPQHMYQPLLFIILCRTQACKMIVAAYMIWYCFIFFLGWFTSFVLAHFIALSSWSPQLWQLPLYCFFYLGLILLSFELKSDLQNYIIVAGFDSFNLSDLSFQSIDWFPFHFFQTYSHRLFKCCDSFIIIFLWNVHPDL